MQGDGLCGPSVVLQSNGIESGIEVVLISGHRGKITIVAAFQIEPQARHLATAILLLAKLCGVVRYDGCSYAQRRVACGQPPSHARGIIDEGTEGDGRITSEVVGEASSPAPGCIAADGAVRDGDAAWTFVPKPAAMLGRIATEGAAAYAHFTFLIIEASTASSRLIITEGAIRDAHLAFPVEKSPTMLGRIAPEGTVRDAHLASCVEKPPTSLYPPIDNRQSFQREDHVLNPKHTHLLVPIQNHRFPIAVQGQASSTHTFPLDVKRAGERDCTGTRKGDRVPIGSPVDEVLKLAIIAAIGDGKSGHGMLSLLSAFGHPYSS